MKIEKNLVFKHIKIVQMKSHLRQLRDARDATGFSRELWKGFAEMGFSGLLVPEAFGGSGLGCVEAGIVMETVPSCDGGGVYLTSMFMLVLLWVQP